MYCKPKLESPPGGDMMCSHGNRFGSNCLFKCRKGYVISGSVQRQCEADNGKPPAYWTGDETHCESKSVIIYLQRKYQSIKQSISQSASQLVLIC